MLLAEPETVSRILLLARELSTEDRQLLAQLLRAGDEMPLPEHATLEEAIAFFLADACSLGRAAELARVTRWELQDVLVARGLPLVAAGDRSADEIDLLAEELEREGLM